MRDLAGDFGSRVGVWRYDPVVSTSVTPPDWHVGNFSRLADRLVGATDEVVVSFAHVYRKTRINMDVASRLHGFGWDDPLMASNGVSSTFSRKSHCPPLVMSSGR